MGLEPDFYFNSESVVVLMTSYFTNQSMVDSENVV